MKFDPQELNDNRVKEGDGWVDDLELVPPVAGVFVFVDADEDVKYVGWGTEGHLQQRAREAWEAGKGKGATQGGWMRAFSDEKAESLYNDLVKKYSPPNN